MNKAALAFVVCGGNYGKDFYVMGNFEQMNSFNEQMN